LDALRHQYITELLGSGEVIAETFVSDRSQSPWERTLSQIEHPHQVKANSEHYARILVDLDKGATANRSFRPVTSLLATESDSDR
jgi:hypothetical protein